MESALDGGAIAPQRDRNGIEDDSDVTDEIRSCSEQLRALCGGHAGRWSGESDSDDDTDSHSAAEIASECLALLESLRITVDDDDHDRDGSDDAVSTPVPPIHSHATETALLREINELGSDLEALMSVLCASASQQSSAPAPDPAPENDSESDGTADRERPASICTSPKMVALTKRLERRPSTQRMLAHTAQLRRHKSFSLGLKSPTPPLGKKTNCERDGGDRHSTKSTTRELLSDAAFWRQYQSKSFQRHLTRQSQARTNQQQEKENESKAIEYRYRRVAKPCYPLAQSRLQHRSFATMHAENVQLPGGSTRPKESYAERFHNVKRGTEADDVRKEDGLLCGVYLHGKRRSHGMLYLTCASLDQLKTRIAKKFSLAQPVVNLYREQVATNLGGARDHKYLHRVTRFNELRHGDLLCATIDGYDDMAMLCAWMKKRQQQIHNYKSPPRTCATQPSKANAMPQAPKPVQKWEPSDSLTYKKPPPPPQNQLWDENGRLVSISHRLALDE